MRAQSPLALCCVAACPLRAPEENRAATLEGRASTQNKVLDYGLWHFQEQVYRRTGGQRDSILEVTDSLQREILCRGGELKQVLAGFP